MSSFVYLYDELKSLENLTVFFYFYRNCFASLKMDLMPDLVLERIFKNVSFDTWFCHLRFVCHRWNKLIVRICQSWIYGLEFFGNKSYVVQIKHIPIPYSVYLHVDSPNIVI